MQGEGWESPTPSPHHPGEGWQWGRAGLGSEGPSPPGAAGLGLGRDCESSPPPPPPSPPQGFNKRSPRRLPPPGPERAAVRGRQLLSYPHPVPHNVCTRSCWEPGRLAWGPSEAASPGTRSLAPPEDHAAALLTLQ